MRIMCNERDMATVGKGIQTQVNWHKLCLLQPLGHPNWDFLKLFL